VLATIYVVANWTVLRPVPGVRAPKELVTVRLTMQNAPARVSWDISHPDFLTLRNGISLRIIGVSEPGFRGAELPGKPLFWIPLGAYSVVDRTASSS
jgi:hypothetical protein